MLCPHAVDEAFFIMVPAKPTTIEIDMQKLDEVLDRVQQEFGAEDYAILKAVVDAYGTITELLDNKNTSIARLRKLLFGATTERRRRCWARSRVATQRRKNRNRPSRRRRLRKRPVQRRRAKRAEKHPPQDTAATGPTPTPGRRKS
jgi:hypothetical protein